MSLTETIPPPLFGDETRLVPIFQAPDQKVSALDVQAKQPVIECSSSKPLGSTKAVPAFHEERSHP